MRIASWRLAFGVMLLRFSSIVFVIVAWVSAATAQPRTREAATVHGPLYRELELVHHAIRTPNAEPLERTRRRVADLHRSVRHAHVPVGHPLREAVAQAQSEVRYRRIVSDPHRAGGTASVEAETRITPGLLRLMNTPGGTIAGLLRNERFTLPRDMNEAERATYERRLRQARATLESVSGRTFADYTFRQRNAARTVRRAQVAERYQRALSLVQDLARRTGRSAAEITWRELEPSILENLLAGAVMGRGGFSENRRIAEVHFPRERISVPLDRQIELNGGVYERGRRSIPQPFMSHVEFGGPEDANALSSIEAHRRQHGRAGRLSSETFDLVWSLGSDMRHQHVHVPFRARTEYRDRPVDAMHFADHWRRANLFAELLAARNSGALRSTRIGATAYWDYSNGEMLEALYLHLVGHQRLSRSLKMAAVGYRTNIYSHPDGSLNSGLEGYEVRYIQANPDADTPDARRTREEWLDAIQRNLATRDYGFSRQVFAQWYREHIPRAERARETIRSLHYNREYAPDQVPATLRPFVTEQVRRALETMGETNYAVRMLVHDWSRDTIWLTASPERRAQGIESVHREQVMALRHLAHLGQGATALQVQDIVRTFVTRSGLLAHTARSFGSEDLARDVQGRGSR